MRRRPPRRTQRGFTLVELMISLVLFSIVIAGVLSVAVSTTVGFRDQRDAVLTEVSVRAPMDFLADAIRNVSPATQSGNVQDVYTCATGAVNVTNSTAAPDALEIVYAAGAVVTTLRTPYNFGVGPYTVTDASQINIGDQLLISDTTTAHIVRVSGIAGNDLSFFPVGCAITPPGGGQYPNGSFVVRVARAKIFVGAVDGIPTLMVDPDGSGPALAEPIAENIEDMQVAVGVDVDGDKGINDPTEWSFSNGVGALFGPIRALRVTLIARAPRPSSGPATFARPPAEDRTAAGAPDNFRRRVLTSTIEIRNLQNSP